VSVGRITVVEESVDLKVTEETVRVSISEQPVVISEQIVGIPGKSDAHFVHDQEVPSAEWTIQHDLGKNPAVTVVDSGGNEWQTAVEHLNADELVVRFSAPFSGRAYLN
jgi:hypothetical protein